MTTRDFTEEEIEAQVKGLDSLQGGSLAAAALIGCGSRAIPALRAFLLGGRPRGIFQPRQLAVETLAELGAKDALLDYLRNRVMIKDPVVRMGEDAVRSTAARELGRWQTEDVFECLMEVGSVQLLPGVVETLGSFRRIEAISYFLRALGDGVCRSSAEEAIRAIGQEAKDLLIHAANVRQPSAEEENGSSMQRRRWVLRILADLHLSQADWEKLQDLINENDPDLTITAARIGLDVASLPDQFVAVRRMIAALTSANWFLRSEARAALAQHFEVAQEAVEDEIARRTNRIDRKAQASDMVLRLLVNLRDRALEESFGHN